MRIIAISRELGSGGRELARRWFGRAELMAVVLSGSFLVVKQKQYGY